MDTQAGMGTSYHTFESVVVMQKKRMLKVFFEERRLELNQVFGNSYPLSTAVGSYNSAPVVKELLRLGANLDGPTYLGEQLRPLQVATSTPGYGKVVRQLLRAGANPHLVPFSLWWPCLDPNVDELLKKYTRKLDKAVIKALTRHDKPSPMNSEFFADFDDGEDAAFYSPVRSATGVLLLTVLQ